jgi:hypothetical protein
MALDSVSTVDPVPSAVFIGNSLDPNLADARLVAAVIAARDAGQRVRLVGNDAGLRWQAKSRGIAAHNLPETWRVQDARRGGSRATRGVPTPPSVLRRRPARGRPLPDPRGLGWEGFRRGASDQYVHGYLRSSHKCNGFAEHHRGAVEASSHAVGQRPTAHAYRQCSRRCPRQSPDA